MSRAVCNGLEAAPTRSRRRRRAPRGAVPGLLLVVDLVPHVEVALQAAALGAAVEDAPLDDAVLPARWP